VCQESTVRCESPHARDDYRKNLNSVRYPRSTDLLDESYEILKSRMAIRSESVRFGVSKPTCPETSVPSDRYP
jgi:hypothetical protein